MTLTILWLKLIARATFSAFLFPPWQKQNLLLGSSTDGIVSKMDKFGKSLCQELYFALLTKAMYETFTTKERHDMKLFVYDLLNSTSVLKTVMSIWDITRVVIKEKSIKDIWRKCAPTLLFCIIKNLWFLLLSVTKNLYNDISSIYLLDACVALVYTRYSDRYLPCTVRCSLKTQDFPPLERSLRRKSTSEN